MGHYFLFKTTSGWAALNEESSNDGLIAHLQDKIRNSVLIYILTEMF